MSTMVTGAKRGRDEILPTVRRRWLAGGAGEVKVAA